MGGGTPVSRHLECGIFGGSGFGYTRNEDGASLVELNEPDGVPHLAPPGALCESSEHPRERPRLLRETASGRLL